MPDHAHVSFHLSKNHALCDVIESLKKDSSKWIKTKGRAYRSFHWQNGYGAFSVSQSNVAQVVKYIEQQRSTIEGAHFKRSFVRFSDNTRYLMTNGMRGIEWLDRPCRALMRCTLTQGVALGSL